MLLFAEVGGWHQSLINFSANKAPLHHKQLQSSTHGQIQGAAEVGAGGVGGPRGGENEDRGRAE